MILIVRVALWLTMHCPWVAGNEIGGGGGGVQRLELLKKEIELQNKFFYNWKKTNSKSVLESELEC